MLVRFGLVLVLVFSGSFAWGHDRSDDLIFAAIGDGPYAGNEWEMLEEQLALVNGVKRISFLAHVGDIWHGSDALPGKHYTRVADMLKTSKKPVYIIPGDNEWNDLEEPDIGWGHWAREFMGFERHFKRVAETAHQDVRPENYAFVKEGVLFVGINLVGGRVHDEAEWKTRLEQDADWVKEHLKGRKDEVRAAVIVGHARPDGKHDAFFDRFRKQVKKFEKPVLYLHGDGHVFDVNHPWGDYPNLWKVQIDQVKRNPPLQIRVTHDAGEPFRFDRTFDEK